MVSFREKFGKKIGTVVGIGRRWDELKIVVAFTQRQDSPFSGEFLVIEEEEGRRRKLLCFVEDPVYGDYTTSSDHRERTLVEKYLRELENIETPLSEEEKKSLFFRCYFVRVIGEIVNISDSKYEIKSVYRYLPELTSICRYPTVEEYRAIVNAGMSFSEEDILYIGNFAVGDDDYEELKIGIAKDKILHVERNTDGIVEKTNGKRTAILARTGYGKSNLCKVLLLNLITKTDFPVLVCDLNGEYAVSSVQGKGFLDIEGIKDKVIVYTEKSELLSQYPNNCFRFKIDFKKLSGRDVATVVSFKESETVGLKQLRNLTEEEWRDVVVEYEKSRTSSYSERRDKIEKALEHKFGSSKDQKNIIRGLSWRLIDILDSWHDPLGRYLVNEVLFFLSCGFTVILDLSLKDVMSGLSIMSFLSDKILSNNIRGFAGNKSDLIPCVLIVEEAQNVLSSNIKEDGRDVFVKIAKEGRKFGISLIYITQQPGSIDESILSQTDNFFVMHLLNEEDIRALQKSNFHYSGCIANFLRNEALVGNVYIYSAPYQPYVFPARAYDFESISSHAIDTTCSSWRPSLKNILEEANKKFNKEDLLKSVHKITKEDGREESFIKIGRLQYVFNDLNLPPCCFDMKDGKKRLKYQHTLAIIKLLKADIEIKNFVLSSGDICEGILLNFYT